MRSNKMSDITIRIDGTCSVAKRELGTEIGLLLKDIGFGKVRMTGKDKRSSISRRPLGKQSVEIKINDTTPVAPHILEWERIKLNEKF
jgi:hypothetical protein